MYIICICGGFLCVYKKGILWEIILNNTNTNKINNKEGERNECISNNNDKVEGGYNIFLDLFFFFFFYNRLAGYW